jgi:hypothetical protein
MRWSSIRRLRPTPLPPGHGRSVERLDTIGLPHFGLGDQNYQLLINTGTTIVTFVMVFCVQHTQNKDAAADAATPVAVAPHRRHALED